MSAINLKSITGITSITTPAGVDNVFTVHTNDTVERFRIDQSGNQNISGIITATAFHGDGSNLTGITGVTINSNVDNRLVTATGTTGTLNGESNLTFDGTTLNLSGNLLPGTDSQYNIGSNAVRFANIYADTLYGDGSNLTGITGVTINNNANNRLVTATGTTGTLDGEVNLTFDGTTLGNENSSGAANLVLKATSNSFNSLVIDSNRSADTQFGIIDGRWNGNVVDRIQFVTGSDGTNKDDGYMAFHTRESGQSLSERLRITSGGNVRVESGVIENAKTISANYTVSTNFNAMSAGPMSIANGVSVTVPSGSAWTIV